MTEDEIRTAFDDIMAGTSVKPFVSAAIYPLWHTGFTRGEPKYERASFYPLMDPEISFQWPWFAEWRAIFAKGDMPESWIFLADRIKDRRLSLREDMVQLLSRTVSMVIYNRRSAAGHAGAHWHQKVFRPTSACAVAQRIADDRVGSLVPGDWKTYPPYFPGDPTSITPF